MCVCALARAEPLSGWGGGRRSKGVLRFFCSDSFLVLLVSCLFLCLGRNPWDGYVVVVAAAAVFD